MKSRRFAYFRVFPGTCVAHLTGFSGPVTRADRLHGPEIRATKQERDKMAVQEKLYRRLAGLLLARRNCVASAKHEWFKRHTALIEELVKAHMPSGGGFDCGTALDFDKSTPERLVFTTSFHHMDESGYVGWSSHTVTVRASLWAGIDIAIGGRNVRDIKEYMHETFHAALTAEVPSASEVA